MSLFKDLIVFEMANNHQGSVEHGLNIIKAMGKITKKYNLNAIVKLQYRQLDTFIHPVKRKDKSIHYVQRFLSTELKPEQFLQFVQEIQKQGMKAMVTPFDEESVDVILEHNVDILKVASCSADDWPLLEKIASAKKPVIASTGGLDIKAIDSLVSFFTHRTDEFALMHCVSIYPTPNDLVNMGFLKKLINRYPHIPIGYSGHEAPDNIDVAKMAIGLGAQMLERHVGVPTDKITLNLYSMNPKQVEKWIQGVDTAREIIGDGNKYITEKETTSLLSLKRGVFARKNVKKGEKLTLDNCYYAFPCEQAQLTSGELGMLRTEYVATKNYKVDEALFESAEMDLHYKIRKIIHDAKGMLSEANIVLNDEAQIELSHHYGIEHFEETGCLLVSIVNREYCKKIIVVFPGQSHPEQYHVKKEETFHVLWGDVQLKLNGINHDLRKGDLKTLERGVRHSFTSLGGAIFEEVSTTHYRGDSFYLDPKIDQQDPMARKTVIGHF